MLSSDIAGALIAWMKNFVC